MTTNLVGTTLGGYQLIEKIGSGGLATVYKAYQPTLERWIAIKVLYYKDDIAMVRFQREARAIARLRHRNIVTIYQYGEDDGWPYIVMEYVEGGTLNDLLSGQPLDWKKVIDLIIPIAEALQYAHCQGVIHRDIKPSNILMPQEDWPLLADFGLVKLTDAPQPVTGPGVSMGTPAYVAPEQTRGIAIDHRADIYSLGAVMFEMVTGRLPFDYNNPNKILIAHVSEPAPVPHQFNPDCPPALEQVILTALQKLPDQRYADMQTMIQAIRRVRTLAEELPAPCTDAPSSSIDPAEETIVIQELRGPVEQTIDTVPAPPPPARIFLADHDATIQAPNKDKVLIGRTFKKTVADIDLGPYGAAKAGVSRHHACLLRKGNGWFIDDMFSLNGTYVNEVSVTPGQPVPLKNADRIRCSQLSFTFLTSIEV